MIIGDNSNNNNFNINTKFQSKISPKNKSFPSESQSHIVSNSNQSISNPKRNVFTKDIFSIEGGDASNSDEMYTKSIAMLNDRLEKGLITMDEFTKKCNAIAKKRNNL